MVAGGAEVLADRAEVGATGDAVLHQPGGLGPVGNPPGEDPGQLGCLVLHEVVAGLGYVDQFHLLRERLPFLVPLRVQLRGPVAVPDHAEPGTRSRPWDGLDRSSSRPGVPTMISTPRLSASICGS